jgi:hypothetical protein
MTMDGILLNILDDEHNRWLFVGVGMLVVMYLVVRPLLKGRRSDPLQRTPRLGLSQQRSVEREMSNLLLELSEMARQVTAQLDTRAAKLDLLMREADERIEMLRDLQNASAPPPGPAEPAPLSHRGDVPSAPQVDSRHLQVYELADQGRSAHEIAEALRRPSGEVELILALRPGT